MWFVVVCVRDDLVYTEVLDWVGAYQPTVTLKKTRKTQKYDMAGWDERQTSNVQ